MYAIIVLHTCKIHTLIQGEKYDRLYAKGTRG